MPAVIDLPFCHVDPKDVIFIRHNSLDFKHKFPIFAEHKDYDTIKWGYPRRPLH